MFCAEVFCHSFEKFEIVCVDCDLRTNSLDGFIAHYQKHHLNAPENQKTSAAVNKTLKYENRSSQYEDEYGLDEHQFAIKNENSMHEDEFVSDEETLFEDYIEEYSIEDSPLNCQLCAKLFFNEESLQRHINECHSSQADTANMDTNSETESQACSNHSNQVWDSEASMFNDLTEIDEKEFTAEVSIQQVENENLTDEHVVLNHFECDYCGREYKARNGLTRHLRSVHNVEDTGSYPCPQCEQVFSSNYKLKVHLLRHTDERKFKCDVPGCSSSFYDAVHLGSHKRSVHKRLRNLLCDICGFRSKRPSMLRNHLRTHTGEKPYDCDQCEKCFRTINALKEHKATHTKHIRPYVCRVCGKTFSRLNALYHHRALHSDVKQFVCKICGKAFKQQSSLSAHKREHARDEEIVEV